MGAYLLKNPIESFLEFIFDPGLDAELAFGDVLILAVPKRFDFEGLGGEDIFSVGELGDDFFVAVMEAELVGCVASVEAADHGVGPFGRRED